MPGSWKVLDRLLEIRSPWVTLIGEQLESDRGQQLNYWRVEKADSIIILPLQRGKFLFPPAMYRPGLGKVTLDFPGGRLPPDTTHQDAAYQILERELGVAPSEVQTLSPLNTQGWPVNSSFSNQKLYGFVAQIDPKIKSEQVGTTYPQTPEGLNELLEVLTCLQCRTVLLEWLTQQQR